MDLLHNANIEPETKILILMYIIYVVLPDMLDEMPEICFQNNRAARSWLLYYKLRTNKCQISRPQINMRLNYRNRKA